MTKVVELCKIYKHLTLEDLQNEVWKDIEGYEGYYQISDMGRVRSLDVRINCGNRYYRLRKGRLLRYANTVAGYPFVFLCKDSLPENILIHRFVGFYFVPNPENKKEVNHKKGLKWDNRATELEWATPSENIKHAYDNGFRMPQNSVFKKLAESDVSEIKYLLSTGKYHQSKIARFYGVNPSSISGINNGRIWKNVKEINYEGNSPSNISTFVAGIIGES